MEGEKAVWPQNQSGRDMTISQGTLGAARSRRGRKDPPQKPAEGARSCQTLILGF